jgi:subtilisin-like proprotein convertase family protein
MRPKPALAILAVAATVTAAWMGFAGSASSQDATPAQPSGEVRLSSSLELGEPYDAVAQRDFEQQLTFDERALLISLVSRSALASADCPLPTSEPRQPFYVKFREPLGRELADRLSDAGASFIGYAYPNTHFIRARDANSLEAIEAVLRSDARVAGTLLQRPEDKCDPLAFADVNDPANSGGDYRLNFWRDVRPGDAADLLSALGASLLQVELDEEGYLSLETSFVDVAVSRPALHSLYRSELIEWLERVPEMEVRNANSTALSVARAQDIGPGTSYNLTGEGLVAGVWDQYRARHTHQQFQNAPSPSPINNGNSRVLKADGTSLGNHGTHVTGTVIGDGSGNGGARGYAPKACVVSYDWNNVFTERRDARHVYRIVADNHSYGTSGGGNGGYDSTAQNSDIDIRDIFLNLCKSAGNSGSGSNTCSNDTCMKNAFVIGATSDTGGIASFSSRGPTNDGRLVPHFTANGVNLTSAYAGSDSSYSSISGTSMSSPSACGSLVLLSELWQRENNRRQFAPDVARGILAVTAIDAYNQGPDYRYGFGIIDCRRAADLILADKAGGGNRIVRGQIRQGEVLEWDLQVSSSSSPLKVACSWLDIWGSTSSSVKLINDLDLVLIAPNNTQYHPWSGLTSGSNGNQTYQWTRTGANRRDNLELVEVDSPMTGTWTVRVTGFNVPANPQSGVLNDVTGFVLVSERAIAVSKVVVEDSLNTGSPISIPDNNTGGITRTFNVSNTGAIEQVRLHVDVKHTRRADVRIRLRHPDNTEVTLNNTGASTRPDLIAVYPDTRQYADDVTALLNKPANGTWTVIVSDHTSGHTGELRYLALEIDVDTAVNPNQPPVADAGPNQTVNEGATVTLNGSNSSDPDNDPLSFQWAQISGPTVTLQNSASAIASFTAPQVSSTQVMTMRLTVNDGNGGIDTDDVTITVNDTTAPNNPPVANAGNDFSITEGNQGSLNGTGSSDPDGDPLSFAWVEVGTSWFILSGANTAQPTFTAPQVATTLQVTFELTVNDGRGGSDTDTVVVTVLDSAVNNPPVADAGPDDYAAHDATYQLDGTGSYDPENDPLSFQWAQIGGGNAVIMTDTDTAIPTFTAPNVDDVLVFQLTVDDGQGNQSSDTVTITVNASGAPPTGGGGTGGGGGGGSKGGCSTDEGSGWLVLLLGLIAGALVWRRRSA